MPQQKDARERHFFDRWTFTAARIAWRLPLRWLEPNCRLHCFSITCPSWSANFRRNLVKIRLKRKELAFRISSAIVRQSIVGRTIIFIHTVNCSLGRFIISCFDCQRFAIEFPYGLGVMNNQSFQLNSSFKPAGSPSRKASLSTGRDSLQFWYTCLINHFN